MIWDCWQKRHKTTKQGSWGSGENEFIAGMGKTQRRWCYSDQAKVGS